MSDKKIYDLLNDVKIDLEGLEDVSEMEKEKYKMNFKNRNVKNKKGFNKAILVASLALIVGISSQTQIGSRVYAMAKSKLEDISYSISDALYIDEDLETYSNIIDQVVESNDVAIKISDVVVDEDELILTSIIDATALNLDREISTMSADPKIYINGKLKGDGGSGSSGAVSGETNIFNELSVIKIDDISLKEDLNIKVVFDELTYYELEDIENNKKIKGKWEFEFTANGEELAVDSEQIELDYGFEINSVKYDLNNFRYNPINQTIKGKIDRPKEIDVTVELRGKDNLGNEIIFPLRSAGEGDILFKYDNFYEDLSDEAEYMILRPYIDKYKDTNDYNEIEWEPVGEEFKIELNR